jgi:thiol:disulfide interchange protein
MVKNIKMGKVSLPMDINSSSAVPAFESMLTKGPMAVVLVYADWCGHCDKYKKNVWSPLKSVKNRTVNMASVREDMLANTSLKDAKIDGYPSILVVGKDKKPAVFNSDSGSTNALPESNDVSTMTSLVTASVPKEVTNTNTKNNAYELSNNSNSLKLSPNNINTGVNISYPSLLASKSKGKNVNINMNVNATTNTAANATANTNNGTNMNSIINSSMNSNTYTPLNNENTANFAESNMPTATNTEPPSIDEDEVTPSSPRTLPANNQGVTPILRGGRLFRRLSMKNKSKSRKTKKSSKRKN